MNDALRETLILYYDYCSMLQKFEYQKGNHIKRLIDMVGADMAILRNQITTDYAEIINEPLMRYLVNERNLDLIDTLYITTFVDFNKSESSIWTFCGLSPKKEGINPKVAHTLLFCIAPDILTLDRYNDKFMEKYADLRTRYPDLKLREALMLNAKKHALKLLLRDIKRAYDYEEAKK